MYTYIYRKLAWSTRYRLYALDIDYIYTYIFIYIYLENIRILVDYVYIPIYT